MPEGIFSSFPVTSSDGRWEIVQGLEIDAFSRERIDASVAELVEERDAVTALGLLNPPALRSHASAAPVQTVASAVGGQPSGQAIGDRERLRASG